MADIGFRQNRLLDQFLLEYTQRKNRGGSPIQPTQAFIPLSHLNQLTSPGQRQSSKEASSQGGNTIWTDRMKNLTEHEHQNHYHQQQQQQQQLHALPFTSAQGSPRYDRIKTIKFKPTTTATASSIPPTQSSSSSNRYSTLNYNSQTQPLQVNQSYQSQQQQQQHQLPTQQQQQHQYRSLTPQNHIQQDVLHPLLPATMLQFEDYESTNKLSIDDGQQQQQRRPDSNTYTSCTKFSSQGNLQQQQIPQQLAYGIYPTQKSGRSLSTRYVDAFGCYLNPVYKRTKASKQQQLQSSISAQQSQLKQQQQMQMQQQLQLQSQQQHPQQQQQNLQLNSSLIKLYLQSPMPFYNPSNRSNKMSTKNTNEDFDRNSQNGLYASEISHKDQLTTEGYEQQQQQVPSYKEQIQNQRLPRSAALDSKSLIAHQKTLVINTQPNQTLKLKERLPGFSIQTLENEFIQEKNNTEQLENTSEQLQMILRPLEFNSSNIHLSNPINSVNAQVNCNSTSQLLLQQLKQQQQQQQQQSKTTRGMKGSSPNNEIERTSAMLKRLQVIATPSRTSRMSLKQMIAKQKNANNNATSLSKNQNNVLSSFHENAVPRNGSTTPTATTTTSSRKRHSNNMITSVNNNNNNTSNAQQQIGQSQARPPSSIGSVGAVQSGVYGGVNTNSIDVGGITKNAVSIDQFEMTKDLGKGSYAIVKLANERRTGKKVAIKVYEKFKLSDPNKFKNIRREINILSKMNHPNIIRLFHVIDSVSSLNLVMEYIGNNSLYNYLREKRKNQLSMNGIRKIFSSIMQGIAYMHGKNVCHRDIKLENILIDEDMNLKIIDFGFAVCSPPERKVDTFCGTPSYMAPEIILKKEHSGQPTDIWAAGIVLYILLCGNDEKDLYRKITKTKLQIPNFVDGGARGLIARCLSYSPEERPTAVNILKDAWLLSTEESKVEQEVRDEKSKSNNNIENIQKTVEQPLMKEQEIQQIHSERGTAPTEVHLAKQAMQLDQ